MSYMKERAELTQKYLREVRGREYTIDEILAREHWRQVWFWWKAKEYYEGYTVRMTMEECKSVYGK